ncbi:IS66 family insertion sequence element accessory protein TnpB [Sphingomonas natans]|uniref:IS66 family insertion sequence element accessory protein TnpB n=1 Tax=Sphingomonas natans TaxID=3063330 RepID=UPI003D670A3E
MTKWIHGLALQLQQGLSHDPHADDFHVLHGRARSLIETMRHDWIGMSLCAQRLKEGPITLSWSPRRRTGSRCLSHLSSSASSGGSTA